MTEQEINQALEENRRRNKTLATDYNPLSGRGACGPRLKKRVKWEQGYLWLPESMVADPEWKRVKDATEFRRLRLRHDFEYWAASCVTIRHKTTGRRVPFVLNAPQRRVASLLEDDRRDGRPLRLIMLKARQWGGSTLVQMYFAWIQTVLRRNWNSLICAQVKDTSAAIRGMYTAMLDSYPPEMWTGDEPPCFRAFEGARNTREIAGRGCRVTVASSMGQEAVRGLDCSMAHLSEVAFWKDSESMTPEAFIRAVCGGIPGVECSMIAMESTANGVGNFFHSEWLRAREGVSAYRPVFVPWHEIEMYRMPCRNPRRLLESMDDYERRLWEKGLTLEMITWYRFKRREFSTHEAMKAEYPTDDVEAFTNSARSVFDPEAVERLREDCREPLATGEVTGREAKGPEALRDVHFTPDATGRLKIWEMPQSGGERPADYVAAVDVGGRGASADWSVIAVMRMRAFERPEVVAQWRGHCDHDLLGWKAAAIARFYNGALLVIESNSLETATEGPSQYILEELNAVYRRLYVRRSRDAATRDRNKTRVGFHTNRATKSVIITGLISMVRDGGYVERSATACNEMATYRQQPSDVYEATPPAHDDVLMTRAIALYVIASMPSTDYTGLQAILPRNQ